MVKAFLRIPVYLFTFITLQLFFFASKESYDIAKYYVARLCLYLSLVHKSHNIIMDSEGESWIIMVTVLTFELKESRRRMIVGPEGLT